MSITSSFLAFDLRLFVGSFALRRITALLIAALAVSFVRKGIVNVIGFIK